MWTCPFIEATHALLFLRKDDSSLLLFYYGVSRSQGNLRVPFGAALVLAVAKSDLSGLTASALR